MNREKSCPDRPPIVTVKKEPESAKFAEIPPFATAIPVPAKPTSPAVSATAAFLPFIRPILRASCCKALTHYPRSGTVARIAVLFIDAL